MWLIAGPAPPAGAQNRQGHGKLFTPLDLALLEGPDRDLWQLPDQIMDALGIAERSVVADIGAGGGWFTIRLARRVGSGGVVFAQDIQPQMLEATMRRVAREGLGNVRRVLGTSDDPHLPPASCDAVLMLDTYHELDRPVAMLRNVAKALKPQGPDLEERVDPDEVVRDAEAAGLRLVSRETFLPYQFMLVFSRAR